MTRPAAASARVNGREPPPAGTYSSISRPPRLRSIRNATSAMTATATTATMIHVLELPPEAAASLSLSPASS